jgi:hypothetical protein
MGVKLDRLKLFESRVLKRILEPIMKKSQETGKHCLVRSFMIRTFRRIFGFSTEG